MLSRRAILISVGAAVVGFGAGAAAMHWKYNQPGAKKKSSVPRAGSTEIKDHPTLKHGWPTYDSIRTFDTFVVAFDTRLRHAKWVLEHFNRDTLKGEGTRNNSLFYEDKTIDPRFRAKLSDYKGSGYDRGHMAPAANHKKSQHTMNSTFVMSNVAPQVGEGFNRDYWARFERYIYELSETCNDVWVVTGPLYLPQRIEDGKWVMQHQMLGTPPQLVGVPTHFYKVVLADPAASPQSCNHQEKVVGAFVMPNVPVDPNTPLSSFAVPLSALEEVAGLQFFPAYITEERRLEVDQAALAWQRKGLLESGKSKDAPLLLPGPSGSPGSGPASSGVVAALGGRSSSGAMHVCHHNGCRLPVPNWWDKGRKKEDKALRRTQSTRF